MVVFNSGGNEGRWKENLPRLRGATAVVKKVDAVN